MVANFEDELKEVKTNLTSLRSSFVDLMELKETLLAADTFFRKVSIGYQVRVQKTDKFVRASFNRLVLTAR